MPKNEIRKIKKMIKRGLNRQEANKIIKVVHESGGFNKANKKARELSEKAIEEINGLPGKKHKNSLKEIAGFVVTRDK